MADRQYALPADERACPGHPMEPRFEAPPNVDARMDFASSPPAEGRRGPFGWLADWIEAGGALRESRYQEMSTAGGSGREAEASYSRASVVNAGNSAPRQRKKKSEEGLSDAA